MELKRNAEWGKCSGKYRSAFLGTSTIARCTAYMQRLCTQLLLIWANLPVNQCSKEIRMMFGAKELHADQELMHGNSSESS